MNYFANKGAKVSDSALVCHPEYLLKEWSSSLNYILLRCYFSFFLIGHLLYVREL